MSPEETIQQNVIAKFPELDGKVRIQRPRRLWVEVPADIFEPVLVYLARDQHFSILCTITGLDEGDTFGILYHLARENGIVANVKVSISKASPVWKTVMGYFPGCVYYERELVDLFGLQIEGLPAGSRYPLPDGWPADQYPLRKDWKPEAAAIGGKEGA